MRIISGTAKGTKINSIEDISTRPTLDRVKESLFNIIQQKIKDSIVLDLFAGSGSLGIECLSRGAEKAYLCDNNISAIKFIESNLLKTKLNDRAIIINSDYKKALNQIKEKIDILFIDPPYKSDLAIKSIKLILNRNMLHKDAIIILETDEVNRDTKELQQLENIEITDIRKYGRVSLIFIKEKYI